MSRGIAIAASAFVLCALSGCGGSGGPVSYIGAFDNEVDYIQWQQSPSGQLRGTVTADHLSGTAPTLILSASTVPFTGTVNGSSVSLTFRRLFDLNAHVGGIISGSTLTLDIAQSDGLIQSAHFTAGSLDAFTKVLARLRRQIQNANTRAARAQAQQRRARHRHGRRGRPGVIA